MIRHQLAVLPRTRTALAPVVAFAFVLLGVYAYRPNDVGPTYAVTAIVLCPVAAWLAAAAAFAEPPSHQQMAIAAAGGPGRALRGRVLALAIAVGALGAIDVCFPAIFGLFKPRPVAADLVAAVLAHGACGALGVGLGLLAVPPAARRPPAAFLLVVGYAIVAVPLYDLAPVLSPAAWLAATLTNAAPRALHGAVVVATLAALAQAAIALGTGEALRRRAA